MNRRVAAGIGLLVLTALGLALWRTIERAPAAITVKGRGCGTKAGLLANPEAQRIWKDRYGIGKVECEPGGSMEICRDPALLAGKDFVWPASLYAIELCQKTLRRPLDYHVTFHSPIVFYSWDCVTRELVHAGLVQQVGGVYYVTNMPRFARLIVSGASWDNRCGLYGKMRVIPTDPTTSNSGSEMTALLAAMLLDGHIPEQDTIGRVLPDLNRYLRSLGQLESTSSRLFSKCVRTGMGECPMFALYESQGIDFIRQNPAEQKYITDRIRFLYPKPTVWAAHQMIALTPAGKSLMRSMHDKDLLDIAWKHHGFRTGSIRHVNDPRWLGFDGIPESIVSVIPLPAPAIVDRMTIDLARP